jgi:HK97 gp10 family phage protein
VSAVEIRGLEALQARLEAAGAPEPVGSVLREEAETIAEGAQQNAPGQLGGTVVVVDQSRGLQPAYAIGTAHRAGRFLEFGTVKMAARPWLWPAFRGRSPGIKHKLERVIAGAFNSGRAPKA